MTNQQIIDRIDEILDEQGWEYNFDENMYYIPAKDVEDMMRFISEYANFLEGESI